MFDSLFISISAFDSKKQLIDGSDSDYIRDSEGMAHEEQVWPESSRRSWAFKDPGFRGQCLFLLNLRG